MAIQYAFLALMLISAQGFSEAKAVNVQDDRGLVEEIGKVIEQLIEFVNYFLESSRQILKELYDTLQEAAKEEIDKALEQIQQLVIEAQAKLADILAKVEELGQDAIQCVKNEENTIIALADATTLAVNECRNTLLAAGDVVAKGVRDAIENSVQQVSKLLFDFNECNSILCQLGVITKIPIVLNNVKTEVDQQIAILKDFVAEEVPKYNSCNQAAILQFQERGNEIAGRIEECVNSIEK